MTPTSSRTLDHESRAAMSHADLGLRAARTGATAPHWLLGKIDQPRGVRLERLRRTRPAVQVRVGRSWLLVDVSPPRA